MLGLKPPPAVLLRWTTLWISWIQRLIVSLGIIWYSSGRNCWLGSVSLRLCCRQSAFRSSGNTLNTMKYISHIQRCIFPAIFHSHFSKYSLAMTSPPIFQNAYILAISKSHIDLLTMLVPFDSYSITMSSLPVLTIWSRHCSFLPFKASMI